MLEIKWFFKEWREATKEQAEILYRHFCKYATAIKWEDKPKYFNNNYIRGGYVLYDGTIETTEERKEKKFQHYKNRLINEGINANETKNLRFIVIEYLCSFSEIDPFEMAASIAKDNIIILFDDSSISKAANKAKENKVKKLLSMKK